MPRGEVADPVFLAGQIVHLQREADGELRVAFLREPDLGHVFIELGIAHPPVIEVVAGHGRMVGEADFRKAGGVRDARIIHGLANRMAAERRVHVQVGGKLHRRSVRLSSFRFQVSIHHETFGENPSSGISCSSRYPPKPGTRPARRTC